MAVEGYTSVEIARLFNETGVKAPIVFQMEKGRTNRVPKGEGFLWNSSTICQMLRNEVYIGNLVQKKFTKEAVGGKNHLNPREDWLITYNHHAPIVDKEVFEKVQKKRGMKRKTQYHPTHPLVGKLVCGCCKKNLQYRKGMNPYFHCSHRYSNAMENCVDQANAMFLEQYVLYRMQDKRYAQYANKELEIRKETVSMNETARKVEAAYSKTEYSRMEHSKTEYSEMEYSKMEYKRNLFNGGKESAVLTKEMMDFYIEKIVVYDEQKIEICWKENVIVT